MALEQRYQRISRTNHSSLHAMCSYDENNFLRDTTNLCLQWGTGSKDDLLDVRQQTHGDIGCENLQQL